MRFICLFLISKESESIGLFLIFRNLAMNLFKFCNPPLNQLFQFFILGPPFIICDIFQFIQQNSGNPQCIPWQIIFHLTHL